MERIRVGFIGCGRHATRVLYPSLQYVPADLIAVCDMNEQRAQRAAKWFGAQRVYTEHRQMLDQENLDAVLVCTGPKTHAPIARDVLDHNLPVFIEKPPALSLAEAEALREYSAQVGQSVMVGLMKRFALIYQRVKAMIDQPSFGPVDLIQGRFGVGLKKGTGYALLLDAGIHFVNLFHFLGGPITSAHGEKTNREQDGTSYAILMRFASGAVGSLVITDQQSWTEPNERLEVTGQGQYLVAENLVRLWHYRKRGETVLWEPGFSIPQTDNNGLYLSGYVPQLQTFIHAVQNGEEPRPNIADACADMAFLKQLEPDEDYSKVPQTYPQWEKDADWFN